MRSELPIRESTTSGVLSRVRQLNPGQNAPHGLVGVLSINGGLGMKRLAFAVGLLVFGLGATLPARADFGVARFASGFCRVWPDTAMVPFGGQYLAFHRGWGGHHWWQYRFPTLAGANIALH